MIDYQAYQAKATKYIYHSCWNTVQPSSASGLCPSMIGYYLDFRSRLFLGTKNLSYCHEQSFKMQHLMIKNSFCIYSSYLKLKSKQ